MFQEPEEEESFYSEAGSNLSLKAEAEAESEAGGEGEGGNDGRQATPFQVILWRKLDYLSFSGKL